MCTRINIVHLFLQAIKQLGYFPRIHTDFNCLKRIKNLIYIMFD